MVHAGKSELKKHLLHYDDYVGLFEVLNSCRQFLRGFWCKPVRLLSEGNSLADCLLDFSSPLLQNLFQLFTLSLETMIHPITAHAVEIPESFPGNIEGNYFVWSMIPATQYQVAIDSFYEPELIKGLLGT